VQIPDSGMTLTAYAARRGVSKMAVVKAVKVGRLQECVGRNERGQPFIADPDLADREWDANTDPTRMPVDSVSTDFQDSKAKHEYFKAAKAEVEFMKAAGELVLASDFKNKLEDAFRSCRSKLLGIPTRAKQNLPHLSQSDVTVLETLVREALEDLANGVTE
jgi:hypothetical protein